MPGWRTPRPKVMKTCKLFSTVYIDIHKKEVK